MLTILPIAKVRGFTLFFGKNSFTIHPLLNHSTMRSPIPTTIRIDIMDPMTTSSGTGLVRSNIVL